MPDIHQLRCFLAVAEELHFGRAARRLRMAQPPLSQHIQRLERELETRLFVRHSRGVRLTESGEALVEGARSVIAELERATEITRRAARETVPTLRIGFTGYSRRNVLPEIVRRFSNAWPDVRIDLIEDSSSANTGGVERGLLDVALITGALPGTTSARSQLTVIPIYSEPLLLAAPLNHPLALRKHLQLGDLAGHGVVLFPERLAPGFHAEIVAACKRSGFVPQVQREVAGYDSILEAVRGGAGISLVPASVRPRARRCGIAFRPIAVAELRATVSLLYSADRNNLVAQFVTNATTTA
jgi:DNA-binding transcriptional LysR family regulator